MADGGRLDTRAEKRPAKPAVKLPTIAGHNTATRSLFNRTWPSTEKRSERAGGRLKKVKRGGRDYWMMGGERVGGEGGESRIREAIFF